MITWEQRTGRKHPGRTGYPTAIRERALRLVAEGKTLGQAQYLTGVSRTTIKRWELEEAGWEQPDASPVGADDVG